MTASAVQSLQPTSLWNHFYQLSQLPRPSKHEGRVLNYLKQFADQHSLKWKQDKTGNLVIARPGSGGGENASTVVIQGHIDMVCEKNADKQHDFFNDPLTLVRADGWLKADGTTLGADNGIGVSAALALLEQPKTAKLPPLECLFTIDEETGLTGAFGLDGSLLTGRTLLNLDTEDWGEIFIGCAGGGDSLLTLTTTSEPAPPSTIALRLSVSGLLGGHSGLNIAEPRGNAVRLAAQVLQALLEAVPQARIAQVKGGDKRNAIAREAFAIILVASDQVSAAQQSVQAGAAQHKQALQQMEKDLSISLSPSNEGVQSVLSTRSQEQLMALLLQLPHGVHAFSSAVPGLVETSNNLAAVTPHAKAGGSTVYTLTMSTRSSINQEMETQRVNIAAIARQYGAEIKQEAAYPGWAPNPESPVLQVTKDVFKHLLGKEPKVAAIHAGLECGIIGEKVPGMDAVSYGPTIRGAHSPDEKVEIATVEPFWQATLQILERLADKTT